MVKFFSGVLILVGVILLLLAAVSFYQQHSENIISFEPDNLPGQFDSASESLPAELIIPSQNIDLKVFPARYINGRWDTTTRGASYLLSSARPGLFGNSVFYGHDWTSLLGKITGMKNGDLIRVKMANGSIKDFSVTGTKVVAPDDQSVLSQNVAGPTLTVYTCTGFLDTQRFVVVAKLL